MAHDRMTRITPLVRLPLVAVCIALLSMSAVSLASAQSSSPAAPTISSVRADDGALVVFWSAPSGASGITAYDARYIDANSDSTVDSNWTLQDNAWTTGGGNLEYAIASLTDGRSYDVQVRAVTQAGDGPWSATSTGTPGTDWWTME